MIRFQTTYEELKLPSGPGAPQTYSFQTTYEELKRDLSGELGDFIPASRLPMRN